MSAARPALTPPIEGSSERSGLQPVEDPVPAGPDTADGTNPFGVQPGQVWEDLEAGLERPRRVEVMRLDGAYAVVRHENGRVTRRKLGRFDGRSNAGYRRVS